MNISANMMRSQFYVCPICGNSIHSMGEAVIQYHGIILIPCQAEEIDENHYISFIAALSPDKLQMVRLYPEGNAEARFKINGVKKLLFYWITERRGEDETMHVIDLTHTIRENMPVYPGTETPKLETANTYEKDGFKETKITMFSHTGTHMDPPAHLYAGRTTLDQFPAEQFIGKALVIDCRDLQQGSSISMDRLHRYGELAEQADFLLFNLGWDKLWGTDAYFGDYPCIDEEVLEYILRGDYKGIGFDVIGLDPIEDVNLVRHNRLFQEKDIINIENLRNLDQCGVGLFWFSCFPLKIEHSDGAPIRAVAWFE